MKSNYKTKGFVLIYSEIGDYDHLEYWFNTYDEAEKEFKELEKEYNDKGFFGYIAEIKLCRSLDEFGELRESEFE